MINLYALKYFCDACNHQSMTKAAELNFVSRPAVSQAIKKLEEELGVSLLVHKRRGFELTPAGHLLMKKSAHTFSQLDQTCSAIKSAAGRVQGTFRIGSARTLVTFELKHVIQTFLSKFPDVDIKIRIYNSEELVQKLADRELDLIVFLGEESLEDHTQVKLKAGQFNLIKPKKSRARIKYAMTERRPETVNVKALYKKKFLEELPIYAEIHSWDAIWNWVNDGVCGGLVPDFLFSDLNQKHEIVLKNVWPYEIKAMYATSRAQDPMIANFLRAF